jgi:hypothetical protein
MYRHKMNSAQCSTSRLRSGAAERKLKEKESQHIGTPPPALTLPRSEQEEELLLPKRKIQLKENNASHLQFLGCDSEDWPVIIGYPEVMTRPWMSSDGFPESWSGNAIHARKDCAIQGVHPNCFSPTSVHFKGEINDALPRKRHQMRHLEFCAVYLLSRMSWVRVPPGAPLHFLFNDLHE